MKRTIFPVIDNHIHLMPVPGRKCPACLQKGETVWVIPGKNCPQCNTSVNRNIILFSVIVSILVISACIVGYLFFKETLKETLFNIGYIEVANCDAPRAWGLFFQDSASPEMEALVELHNIIMFYLFSILFAVGWVMLSIVTNHVSYKSPISNKYLKHGTLVELIWTITPILILMLIAFPSYKLLYLMDEITDPSLTLQVEGHQWYWSYQYAEFSDSDGGSLVEFDSYVVPESDLPKGGLRNLEVDNRVILPEITHTRFVVSAADVIHSFAMPALGIKCDAYPGRLNQVSVLINRLGTYYGQCSEICGMLHSSMPVVIQALSLEKFLIWLKNQ